MTLHLMFVNTIFSSVAGHLLGNSCLLVLFAFWQYVILVISHFGSDGGIWVLIDPALGHCILVTYNINDCRKEAIQNDL